MRVSACFKSTREAGKRVRVRVRCGATCDCGRRALTSWMCRAQQGLASGMGAMPYGYGGMQHPGMLPQGYGGQQTGHMGVPSPYFSMQSGGPDQQQTAAAAAQYPGSYPGFYPGLRG
eukprot:3492356-Rhodomonas_salina.2